MEAIKTIKPDKSALNGIEEKVATIYFSKDRKKIRIEDNIGNRISLPASGPRDQNRVEIKYMSGYHRYVAPCECHYVWINGRFELRTPGGDPCPHY